MYIHSVERCIVVWHGFPLYLEYFHIVFASKLFKSTAHPIIKFSFMLFVNLDTVFSISMVVCFIFTRDAYAHSVERCIVVWHGFPLYLEYFHIVFASKLFKSTAHPIIKFSFMLFVNLDTVFSISMVVCFIFTRDAYAHSVERCIVVWHGFPLYLEYFHIVFASKLFKSTAHPIIKFSFMLFVNLDTVFSISMVVCFIFTRDAYAHASCTMPYKISLLYFVMCTNPKMVSCSR